MTQPSEAFVRRVDWLLLAAGFLVFLWMQHGIWGDGEVRGRYIRALLSGAGHVEGYYSYIGPLFATPLLALDRALGLNEWLFARFNVFVLAAGLAVGYRALAPSIDRRLLRVTGLLLLVASLLPLPLLTFYGEVFTATGLAVGIALVACSRPWGWLLAAVAAANTPATVPALGLAALYFALNEGRLRHLAAPVLAAGFVLLESFIRRGVWLHHDYISTGTGQPGYLSSGEPGFSYPFFFGAMGLLFSFGRGLLWWQPSLLLAFKREPLAPPLERTLRASGWVGLGLLLVYSKWWAWNGAAWSGPRFLIFATFPAMLLLAQAVTAPPRSNWHGAATLGLLLLSVYSGINSGVLNYFKTLDRDPACGLLEGVLCVYTPKYSALWVPFWKPVPTDTAEKAFIAYALGVLAWVWVTSPIRLAGPMRAGLGTLRDRILQRWRL